MIEKPISINFIKKAWFYGSYKGMRYIYCRKDDKMVAYVYPQPYCFEATPEDQIISAEFEFNEEGYNQAVSWVNEQYDAKTEEWNQLERKM